MDYRDFDFWNEEKLWKLRKEICLGSMYYSDYENSFGIPKKVCCDFFDSFIDLCFFMESEENNDSTNLKYIYNKYDNAESLWNYFFAVEYPFGE